MSDKAILILGGVACTTLGIVGLVFVAVGWHSREGRR